MTTWNELSAMFLACKADELKPHTQKFRKTVYRQFGAFKLAEVGPPVGDQPAAGIRPIDVLAFLHRQYRSNGQKAAAGGAIRACCLWGARNGLLPSAEQLEGLKLPKCGKRRGVTESEFLLMVEGAKKLKMWIFVEYLHFLRLTGCRPGEASTLTWGQINERARTITLLQHKTFGITGQPRHLPVTDSLIGVLKRLRAVGHKVQRPDDPKAPVFCARRGGFMRKNYTSKRLSKIRSMTGLDRAVSLHGIRHLFATDFVDRGGDIHILSQILGHSSIETTIRQYLHLRPKISEWVQALHRIEGLRSGEPSAY